MANTATTQRNQHRRQQSTSHPEKVSTLHAGRWKTMTHRFEYESDLSKAFLDQNHRRMIQLFERLGMIMKTAKQDAAAYRKVMDWHNNVNLAIANEQIETLDEQLNNAISKIKPADNAIVNTPDSYFVDFEVSHPVSRTILIALGAVDKMATRIEQCFYEGRIDDLQLEDSRRQTIKVMNGVLDRINKVTSPGKRKDNSGRFSTSEYVKFLKDPNSDLLALTDMPLDIRKRLGLIDEPTDNPETEEPVKSDKTDKTETATSQSEPTKKKPTPTKKKGSAKKDSAKASSKEA